ncbi:hypothetical protein UFOVP1301_57 [uncultured Caudovirales phage]|uniref:Uncharacterized protein n=1 Tax=uncultured Caudovirales phage TaxID=2100421 RepID=A0A6J5NE42_9CAUD|nr:hypothetical protein UFOVP663_42 [uncultured Caudovirales phage]CAB4168652.1 hypothetical protein UFOVP894_18 [uncultured Caudovirales phage]CAB4181003.1 hypothetical protein UFOVP1069_10 [uncultured Caudovirales phage]CAB4196123.1 hypothetical protein UFOVP1301_57 [uncultured Caudovirales phage]CAB4210934.1 hypothetical protein UFOVP1415_57 [uncultured Caudovirales phage]
MYWILYRAVMRLAHKHGWHYAPQKHMPLPNTSAPGTYSCWCTWCGLRGTVYKPTKEQSMQLMRCTSQLIHGGLMHSVTPPQEE